MITIRFSGRKPTPDIYRIGQETDQNAEKLRFDLPQIADGQTANLYMNLPDGTPEVIGITDGMASVSAAMTEQPGRITAWVGIQGGGNIAWNSELLYLDVGDLPPITEQINYRYPTALQEALDVKEAAKNYRDQARDYAEYIGHAAAAIEGDLVIGVAGSTLIFDIDAAPSGGGSSGSGGSGTGGGSGEGGGGSTQTSAFGTAVFGTAVFS